VTPGASKHNMALPGSIMSTVMTGESGADDGEHHYCARKKKKRKKEREGVTRKKKRDAGIGLCVDGRFWSDDRRSATCHRLNVTGVRRLKILKKERKKGGRSSIPSLGAVNALRRWHSSPGLRRNRYALATKKREERRGGKTDPVWFRRSSVPSINGR